jgi:hypothetical protein
VQIDPAQYGYSPDRSRRLLDELGERVRRLPSVRSVATADRLPLSLGPARLRTVSLDNRDCAVSRCPEIDTDAVDGDFFRSLNVPLRAGRAFEPQDGAEAVIVNESAARLWPQGRAP